MKSNANRHKRLADYIYNDLGPEESEAIKREMSENPDLAESYRMSNKVKKYLKAKIELEEMRSDPSLAEAERLAEIAHGNDPRAGTASAPTGGGLELSGPRKYLPAAVAAAAAIILVIIGLSPSFTSADRLFQTYYEPLDASGYTRRGDMTDLYLNMAEGIKLYNQGAYDKSNRIFSHLYSIHAPLAEVRLFSGLTYMGLGEYDTAVHFLEELLENNVRYIPEATWYLSLCCLKTGALEKAGDLLAGLDEYEGLYSEQAQDLRRKLQRIKK
ncbi:MAG TPA: hypothetical protein ENO20_01075 [Bacteroides sp.]|nr:hypothetical protein [Bacteroides sp.]